jgi:hypothetical protein
MVRILPPKQSTGYLWGVIGRRELQVPSLHPEQAGGHASLFGGWPKSRNRVAIPIWWSHRKSIFLLWCRFCVTVGISRASKNGLYMVSHRIDIRAWSCLLESSHPWLFYSNRHASERLSRVIWTHMTWPVIWTMTWHHMQNRNAWPIGCGTA